MLTKIKSTQATAVKKIFAKTTFNKKILSIAILSTINTPVLFAQENTKTTQLEEDLEVITVSASRSTIPKSAIPNTIRLIGEEEFAQEVQFSGSAIEAISSLVPSFSPTREKMTGYGETLRGRNPLFLIDGVPQANPIRDGSRDGYTVDPFFIESVEVIFGSNAIQGVGATGGVINYKTASAPKKEGVWAGKALAQYSAGSEFQGDADGYRIAGLVGKDFGEADVTFGAATQSRGAYYSGDGRRVGLASAQGEIQDSKSTSFYAKAGFDFSKDQRIEMMAQMFELKGDGDYVNVPGSRATNTPSTSEKGTILGKKITNDVTTVSLTYLDKDFAGGFLTGQIFYQDFESLFGGGINGIFQSPELDPNGKHFEQSANNSTKNGARIAFERKVEALEGFRFVAGLDYINDKAFQALIFSNRNWVPETTFTSTAPFLQLHQGLLDNKVHISAGIRQENAEIKVDDYSTIFGYGGNKVGGGNPDFTETLVNIGATYDVFSGFTVYSSFAQGFTMPDVGRILRAIRLPNLSVDNIINIEPVVSDNIELGLDWLAQDFKFSAAYFQSESKNGSRLVLIDEVFEVKRQPTDIKGFEIMGTWYTPTEGLLFSVGYAKTNGETDTTGDGKLDSDLDGGNISPDRVNVTMDYAVDNYSMQLRTRTYLARDFSGKSEATSFDGYTLVDAFFNYETEVGDFFVSASNILDKQYVSYDSQTVRIDNDARFFAGRGRAINLGFKWDF